MNSFSRLKSYLKAKLGVDLFGRTSIPQQRKASAQEREKRSSDIAFSVLRVGAGGIVIPHGVSQLMGGGQSMAVSVLTKNGIIASPRTAFFIIVLELVGGIGVTIGFYTRPFAGALAIEMWWVAYAFWLDHTDVNLGSEYASWEFPFVLGCVMFVLTVFGGGPWSLDRAIGND